MVDMVYKTFRVDVKAVNEVTGEVDMLIPMSTASVDRDGESINPMGWKKSLPAFRKRPILLSSHDYRDLRKQIGEFTRITANTEGLFAKPKYYINEGNEEADWAFKLASKGVAAYSVGFIPTKWTDGDGDKEPRRTYEEQELLEISHVVVPSNRDAIQSVRSKSIDPVINEILDEVLEDDELITGEEPQVIKDIITKPEETEEFIRIPVRDCKVTATIDISRKEGISALYCGKEKQVRTYLFRKDKGWTMAKAKAWVKEHEGKSLEPHDVSQEEIKDEIDYLTLLIKEHGLSDKLFESMSKLIAECQEPMEFEVRLPGDDIPVKDIEIGDDLSIVDGDDLSLPTNTITYQEIQEAIKRIANKQMEGK